MDENEKKAQEQQPAVPQMSNRDKLLSRYKEKYPDKSYDDDEALYGQVGEDYDAYDNEIKGYKADNDKLTSMFNADPRAGTFLSKWADGGDPTMMLVEQFGDEFREALDDPSKQDQLAEANKKFLERVAKEKELEEQYQANLQESLDNLKAYQDEHGMSDEEVDEGMEKYMAIVGDAVVGKFSPENLALILGGMSHDQDVEAAAHEGEVKGRNANIKAAMRRAGGDGAPRLAGSNNTQSERKQRRSLFDVAADAR